MMVAHDVSIQSYADDPRLCLQCHRQDMTSAVQRLESTCITDISHWMAANRLKLNTKSCSLDPMPTFLLRDCIDSVTVLSFLTVLVNTSLREGHSPASQKKAVVTPLVKKPSLDTQDIKNYRPVSNLTFVSKLVERVAVKQLVEYLEANELMPRWQSAYRRHHSTETALLKVLSDALTAADNQKVTLLALLDLSAAFDCVDHDILLSSCTPSLD